MKKTTIFGGVVLVVVVAAAAFVLRSGTPKGEKMGASEREGEKSEVVQANLDPKEIEKKVCEHNIKQIDCDECRYQLGVVKAQPSVTNALVRTVEVKQVETGTRLKLTGEVRFDETAVVDVLPVASGKIVEVKARLGQKVNSGDVLAVLHSKDYGEAKAVFLEAVATADIATRERTRQVAVSAALEKLVESTRKGQPAMEGGSPLGEWKSKLIEASARLQQARVVQNREESLLAKQASSKAEWETAVRELHTAEAAYAALVEEVQLNLDIDRIKAENAASLAEAKLNAAEQHLRLFGLNKQEIDALTGGKENGAFAQIQIKAPRSGIVTAQDVVQGKFVETTQTLFTVADTSNLWIWCDLYEKDLGALHKYMADGHSPKATVKVAAFSDTLTGVVDHVGSVVDETTRTIKVRVQVKNEHGKLKPGMFATVEVELPEGKNVAIVPRSAVLSDEGRYFVFQHWKDDLWLKRDVVPDKVHDEGVEVAGIEPGAKVVASGGFLFKSDILREKMGAGCAD